MKNNTELTNELEQLYPLELQELLNNKDFNWIADEGYKRTSDGLIFTFSVVVTEDGEYRSHFWKLICNDRKMRISREDIFPTFSHYSEHILLSEFKGEWSELFFRKAAKHPEKVLCDIYGLHKEVFQNFFPIEKFVVSDLNQLCHLAGGCFSYGPMDILQYYYEILEKNGMEPYWLYTHQNGRGKNQELNKNLRLMLFGDSYFIGENFRFEKV